MLVLMDGEDPPLLGGSVGSDEMFSFSARFLHKAGSSCHQWPKVNVFGLLPPLILPPTRSIILFWGGLGYLVADAPTQIRPEFRLYCFHTSSYSSLTLGATDFIYCV